MKSDKTPVIGFICVMLCCTLVLGIAIALLSSVNNTASAGTTDISDNNSSVKSELEFGYTEKMFGQSGPEVPGWGNFYFAYRSEKRTLDIDSVKLTISFGVLSYNEIDAAFIEYKREYAGWDIPEFKIYFADEDGSNIQTAREVKESFINEKYRVKGVVDEPNNLYSYVFNHSEEITIPKELFTESEGIIKICVGGMNVAGNEPEYAVLCYEYIKYQLIENNKVVLSPCWEW